jgi:hypothetical protein
MHRDTGPSTFFHDLMHNLRAGAAGVSAQADRLPLTEQGKTSLEAEVALYSDLAKLVDTGVPPPPSARTPVDPSIIDHVRSLVAIWTDRVKTEADGLPVSEAERSEFKETLKTADAIRAYLESYPIVPARE